MHKSPVHKTGNFRHTIMGTNESEQFRITNNSKYLLEKFSNIKFRDEVLMVQFQETKYPTDFGAKAYNTLIRNTNFGKKYDFEVKFLSKP